MDQMISPLMRLRLAYLRVIAKSWRDKEFKKSIVNTGDIFETLKEYGFDSPWEYLEFHLVDDEPKTMWKPMETAGWIGSNDRFVLYIPAKPDETNCPEQALASYYQMFPTLFGPTRFGPSGQEIALKQSLNYDLGVGPEPFLEFGAVTLRAIALAWENPEFRQDLATKNGSARKEAKTALSRWLGYTCPWNFDINFVEHPDFTWQPESGNTGAWNLNKIPKNIIELHYPEKPEEEQFYAIALTSYNATGPAYPFSCG